jgi:hypothetical protein
LIDPSGGKYSKDITLLNHKNLSDEELVRLFLENKDEETFNKIKKEGIWVW